METKRVYRANVIPYQPPTNWIEYDARSILTSLAEAKGALLALVSMPHQKSWLEELQVIQLKREVAGTSRIEGAEFTERELDAALKDSPTDLMTRSQRQAHAAMVTYKWLCTVPHDRPVDCDYIREIHRRIVTGADDDHCPPGEIRARDQNVTFGIPRHRGAEGGDACKTAFQRLCQAAQIEFKEHDDLIQALAIHYHFAAMHPFLDGNGRTARALESFMLRKAGLKDTVFIAMSNYYYDEKNTYLQALSAVRANDHDLTAFLLFGLRGVKTQCDRVRAEISLNVKRSLFRNLMYDLFNRLETKRKRVVAERQVEILKLMLIEEEIKVSELMQKTRGLYADLEASQKTLVNDLVRLVGINALNIKKTPESKDYTLSINLDWPTVIDENGFLEKVKKMPKAKSLALFASE